ncbi:zinc ribbon domain-containing protein [Sphingomonas sp. So64.6b]|uniref:zinc-ribbon domain-containing protein n=1 Tax=Sphingomonas sp. So64.6b TaxID=2997354 RepID=UPI001603ABB6|nr:zinc-ribbon domain-containing protein [Sphingomonas sp. So64.6b]QNA82570.1 zinc ribbon domain-containing protein [Sphingomonas sp. So64.6b]
MECATCDTELTDDARYCSNCGTSASSGPGTWRSAANDDVRAARAFAADARQRHALPDTLPDTLGASMAKGAAIGAVVALPVPLIGPLAGAVVGAGVAAFQKLTED